MRFSIGDKVRLVDEPDVIGCIKRRFNSENTCESVYLFALENGRFTQLVHEDEIEIVSDNVTYRHEFDYLDTVVVARFFEVHEDGTEVELARGHGHIIHEGAIGIAQAASYALKKVYEKCGGTF